MSYGTVAGVEALVQRYTNASKEFDYKTRPTRLTVERFISQVSALIDSALLNAGFSLPIESSTYIEMFDMLTEQHVAELVEGVNGSGRFGPSEKKPKEGRFGIINMDIIEFIESIAQGLVNESENWTDPKPKSKLYKVNYSTPYDNTNIIQS